jgi:hypothetical protein
MTALWYPRGIHGIHVNGGRGRTGIHLSPGNRGYKNNYLLRSKQANLYVIA